MHRETQFSVPTACKANTPVHVSSLWLDDVNISKISINFSRIWLWVVSNFDEQALKAFCVQDKIIFHICVKPTVAGSYALSENEIWCKRGNTLVTFLEICSLTIKNNFSNPIHLKINICRSKHLYQSSVNICSRSNCLDKDGN